MPRRSFFTTFEISQICEVNPTTVQNWVKEKKLKAYVTPGGHRRVRREDLIAFMKEFGMPLPDRLRDTPPLVMLVDDEVEVLDVLTSVMLSGKERLEVARAESGVEALLMIGERKPDLLILDIMMPGMNGFEVCERLKESPSTRNIRIVAITGDHDPATSVRILRAGADLFFTKPLNVTEFRSQCLKLLKS
jgi:excisionase family DNA binding protein